MRRSVAPNGRRVMSVRVLLEVTGEGGGGAALLCSSSHVDSRRPCMES